MPTTTSLRLTISACPTVHRVHGSLDGAAAADLQRVLNGVLADRETTAIISCVTCNGVDLEGISGLGALAELAGWQNVALTLNDPTEQLCEALQSEGLTELIRMVHKDLRPPWRAAEIDRLRPGRTTRRAWPADHHDGAECDAATK